MKKPKKNSNKSQKSKQIKPIPFRRSLFWDVNPKDIDPNKHAQYIIERILEFGNKKELQWLFAQYPKQTIRNAFKRSHRVLHAKSKALWSLVLK